MDVPSELICPLTKEIMEHPVATRYGIDFERSAIIAWLDQGSGECPLTRKPLMKRDLIYNKLLKTMIQAWHAENREKCEATVATCGDDDSDESFHLYGTDEFPYLTAAGPGQESTSLDPMFPRAGEHGSRLENGVKARLSSLKALRHRIQGQKYQALRW